MRHEKAKAAPHRCGVLVIDDDAAVGPLVATLLRREAMDVVMATNGTRGLELLQNGTFTVVLLDLMMHGVSGWDVLQVMQQRSINVPVIVITATTPRVRRALDSPFIKAIVEKPFDIHELVEVVRRCCHEA